MDPTALNADLLRPNDCFGCGPENPEGLHIEIFRDGSRTDRLVGRYTPKHTAGGFPEIVHGGLQFTALDCMAGWVTLILRSPGKMMPLTTSATIRYLRPARMGSPLTLSATVVTEAPSPREPMRIRGEIRDGHGELLSEADLDYVLMPEDRFRKLVGTDRLPHGYLRHFGQAE